MNEKRVKEQVGALGNPAKRISTKKSSYRLQFRLANVRKSKGHCMKPKPIRAIGTQGGKKQPATEEEFPSDQFQEGVSG